jgi:hypothetical protein
MAGETWRDVLQVGRETTYGTAVAATRKVYVEEPSLTRELAVHPHRFATGTRDNQRAVTLGATTAAGQVRIPVSGDELLEWLEITFGAGVVTTPAGATNARRHTYKPGSTSPPSMTIERNDGARVMRATGVMTNQLTVAGNVRESNNATFDLFAAEYIPWAGPLTGSLADRTPDFLEGWQTKAYLDAFGGTAGTTLVSSSVLNWSVTVANGLGRKYYAGNTRATGGIVTGPLEITAQLTLEAAPAIAATELTNWDTSVLRLLRLEFTGPVDQIEISRRTMRAPVCTSSTATMCMTPRSRRVSR